MYRALCLGVAVVALASCVTQETPAASRIRIADQNMVTKCRFLGDVRGTSGFSGVAAATGQQNAMNEALNKAAKMGATDVVWNTVASGWGSNAFGAAYRCPAKGK